tara:strand:- start:201 stop:335 length:135 start_codon:yes stop_codon:yes gene_type:complete
MTELVEKLKEQTAKITEERLEEAFEVCILVMIFITSVLAIAPIV